MMLRVTVAMLITIVVVLPAGAGMRIVKFFIGG
jgi:hypothetical protein